MAKIRSICVYCGSAEGTNPAYREAAAWLGAEAAARGVDIIYGGGRIGLMGVIADAALAAGGTVTGIIPRHLVEKEIGHGDASHTMIVETMHQRKQRMSEMADAFVVLPGGFGTLDEAFEIITWKQLELHAKPVMIVDVAGYWRPLAALIDHGIANGFIRPSNRDLYTLVDGAEALFPALEAAPETSHDVISERM